MSVIVLAIDPKDVSKEAMKRAKELAGDRRLLVTTDRKKIEAVLDDIEIAAGGFPLEWVERAPALRWFQQWFAGADWLKEHPAVIEKDFVLTNASGVHAIPISEHILALLLAFARNLPQSIHAQQEEAWTSNEKGQVFELAGKVMLLIGVGAIGKRTAQIAKGLGMRVWGVRRNPDQAEEEIERMVSQQDFASLLPESDFVVLTVPETDETRCMIDRETLAQMKPSAILINIGRGGTVDEPALIEALKKGTIAGAGLDVFSTEPLPARSPLWKLPNVIITPHSAGDTPLYDARAMEIFLDNLFLYTQNKPLKNVVDKKLGY